MRLDELILCGITAAFFIASLMLSLNFAWLEAASFLIAGTFGVFCLDDMDEGEA